MSKIDYQALREKAEKATSGEWSLEYGESRFDGDDALIHREVAGYIPICRIEGAHPESGFDEDFQMEQQANAEFIAAASPATVLALLDERERNQQYIKRRDQENEDIALTVGKLRVELEAEQKTSAARLEALDRTHKMFQREQCRAEAAEKRIAELESGSQAQKLVEAIIVAIENEQERLFDEDYLMDSKECIDVIREEVKRWNDSRAAGIRIKGE
ncbi:ead/Ea22-like family protein [Escherichia coli]|uniref:Ead/Ea22-like family protein n=1 Tax=Escherichia coli TaxID=562 RepID=A0A4C9H8H1_ECOLX|nr:ead/Ea22-like family protein [Escherichia coli]EHK2925359.1 ead/Ea22-like family protein [Escherichia coli]EHK3097353.1 ead/Ea22-like family protein [Escherichia coli]EHY1686850.1 ead/Ea22-like family protein [Escherichia coli]EKS8196325.1 ead/Ea22-like family protein [Escherichia coli]EKS8211453.1 ead/Ea22-like family protein [Escherichia coli]